MMVLDEVGELCHQLEQMTLDRDHWKRLYETVVVKDEGMELYSEIYALKQLLKEAIDPYAWRNVTDKKFVAKPGSFVERVRNALGVGK